MSGSRIETVPKDTRPEAQAFFNAMVLEELLRLRADHTALLREVQELRRGVQIGLMTTAMAIEEALQ